MAAVADIGQMMRFATVGVATAAVYFGLYVGLEAMSLAAWLASAMAYLIAITVQYFGHAWLTFQRKARDGAQLARFLTLNGVGLLAASLAGWGLTDVMQFPAWVSGLFVITVLPLVNFVIMRIWVFAE